MFFVSCKMSYKTAGWPVCDSGYHTGYIPCEVGAYAEKHQQAHGTVFLRVVS